MISLCQNYPMQVKEEFLAFKVISVSSCRSVDVKGHKQGSSRGRGGLMLSVATISSMLKKLYWKDYNF